MKTHWQKTDKYKESVIVSHRIGEKRTMVVIWSTNLYYRFLTSVEK